MDWLEEFGQQEKIAPQGTGTDWLSDFEDYEPQEVQAGGVLSPVVDLLKGVYTGFRRRIPEQIGQAMEFTGVAPESGKALKEWAREGEEPGEKGMFAQAGEMIPASSAIPAALNVTGEILTKVPHPYARLAGLGVKGLSYVAAPLLFGLSQARSTEEAGEEQIQDLKKRMAETDDLAEKGTLADELSRVQENMKWAPYVTGGTEALGETFGNWALLRLLGPLAGKATAGTLKDVLKPTLGKFTKELATRTLPTEILTEMGQNYAEAMAEKKTGIRPTANPWEEAVSAVGPTAIMTLLTGAGGRVLQSHVSNSYLKDLSDPETDSQRRQVIADSIGHMIETDYENPELASQWNRYASNKISAGEAIDPNMALTPETLNPSVKDIFKNAEENSDNIDGMSKKLVDDLASTDPIALKQSPVAFREEFTAKETGPKKYDVMQSIYESLAENDDKAQGITPLIVDEYVSRGGVIPKNRYDLALKYPNATFEGNYPERPDNAREARWQIFELQQKAKESGLPYDEAQVEKAIIDYMEKYPEELRREGRTDPTLLERVVDRKTFNQWWENPESLRRAKGTGVQGNIIAPERYENEKASPEAIQERVNISAEYEKARKMEEGPEKYKAINAAEKRLFEWGLKNPDLLREEERRDVLARTTYLSKISAGMKPSRETGAKEIPTKSLRTIIIEKGGLSRKGFNRNMEDVPGGNVMFREGGEGLDLRYRTLVEEGYIPPKPADFKGSNDDYLWDLIVKDAQGIAVTLERLEKQIDDDIMNLEDIYVEAFSEEIERTDLRRVQKEAAAIVAEEKDDRTPQELAQAGQNLVEEYSDVFVPEEDEEPEEKTPSTIAPVAVSPTHVTKSPRETKKTQGAQKTPPIERPKPVETVEKEKPTTDLSSKSLSELVAEAFSIINDHIGERGSISGEKLEINDSLYQKLKPILAEIARRAKEKALDVKSYLFGAVDSQPEGSAKRIYEAAAERYAREEEKEPEEEKGQPDVDKLEAKEPEKEEPEKPETSGERPAPKTSSFEHTIFGKNYKKLEKLFTKWGLGKPEDFRGYEKLSAGGGAIMDFNVEFLREDEEGIVLALSHYYEQNGDMVPDPDMEIRVLPGGAVEALTYQDYRSYQQVYPEPGKVNIRAKIDLNNFLGKWLSNVDAQGHMPKREKEKSAEYPDLTITGQGKPLPNHPEAQYVVHQRKPDLIPHTYKVVITRRSPWLSVNGTGMSAQEAYDSALAIYESKAQPTEEPTAKPEPSSSVAIADWVRKKLESEEPFTKEELYTQAAAAFGGTQAEGKFTPKDAFDAMELGINKYILSMPEFNPAAENAGEIIQSIRTRIMDKIPSQMGSRTEETNEFQQFSTPPDLAYVMNWVANIQKETVLEPSAGIGGLAAFAKNTGSKVIVNELSPRRAKLLKEMGFDEVYTENAEQLNNILPDTVTPSVIVMNPPFSASAGRIKGERDPKNLIRHIGQALVRLQDDGRLVVLTGAGLFGESKTFNEWLGNIGKTHDVLADITISGKGYSKYGTTFNNRLIVIDKKKTGATIIKESVDDVKDAIPLLQGVRNARTHTERSPIESESQGTLGGTKSGDLAGSPLLTSTGGVGNGTQQNIGVSGVRNRPLSGPRQAGKPVTGETTEMAPDREGVRGTNRPSPTEQTEDSERGGTRGDNSGTDHGQNNLLVEKAEKQYEDVDLTETDVYEKYVPYIVVKGAQEHPTKLVESAAMAAVSAPDTTYTPNIPQSLIDNGKLSDVQLEAIIRAGHAHQEILPNGHRKGFFIGDGTGVGKGREIAGIILDNWNRGRKKAVWVSKNTSLIEDAKRDLRALGMDPNKIINMSKIKLSGSIPQSEGIVFVGYDTLKTDRGPNNSRLKQIVKWMGEKGDGVIAFDEAHLMGNAIATKGKRGAKKPAERALRGVELQNSIPLARIVYASATGATELSNLSYCERLGLWGQETPFPKSIDFISSISKGGMAAMELVAQALKSAGSYLSRNLSLEGVETEVLTHELTSDQREMYDELAKAWQIVLNNIHKAFVVTGVVGHDGKTQNSDKKKNVMGQFWGSHLRFFNQLLVSMQTPSLIRSIEKDIAEGRAAVIQLVNTNEAQTDRAIANLEEDQSLEELDITPREQLIDFLKKSFPIQQYEEYIDDKGNIRSRPVYDSQNNPVVSKEAVAMRDALIQRIGAIRFPENALDMIINHFGANQVAEVTGRSRRVVYKIDEAGNRKRVIENWSKAKGLADTNAFMDDKKRILCFSDAGGTGKSYHADLNEKNQRKRVHYILQAGWRADAAVQGIGRTHRSNQKQPPMVRLVTTNLKGQKRFMSSIARRLEQLGSLTKGQRDTASQGIFTARDNLESPYARDAWRKLCVDIAMHNESVTLREFEQETGLKLTDNNGGLLDQLPDITQFLNRLLSMTIDRQNKVFDMFSSRLDKIIEKEAAAGTLDVGLETLKAKEVRKVQEQVVYKHKSGAETKYVQVDVINEADNMSFATSVQYAKEGYFVNNKSGNVWAASALVNRTDATTGRVYKGNSLYGPNGQSHVVKNDDLLNPEKYRKVSKEEAEGLWNEELKALPKEKKTTMHFITGSILPIWDRLPDEHVRIMRMKLNTGDKLLGRLIPPKSLTQVLGALQVSRERPKMSPSEVYDTVMSGSKIRLANQWTISRRIVSGEYRIEVDGDTVYRFLDQLKEYGAYVEEIRYRTRVFVPTGPDGQAVISTILDKISPMLDIEGVDIPSYSKGTTYRQLGPYAPEYYHADKLRTIMTPFLNKFPESVRKQIEIIQGNRDFPEDFIKRAGGTFDINNDKIYGAYDPVTGKIYIVADAIRDPQDAERTVIEELVGHKGLSAILTRHEHNLIKYSVYHRFKGTPEMEKIIKDYGFNVKDLSDMAAAGEEYMVHHMPTVYKTPSLWQRIVAVIRGALRRYGLVKSYSDTDIRILMDKAAQAVVMGRQAGKYTTPFLSKLAPVSPFYSQLLNVVTGKIKDMPGKTQSIIPWLQKQGVKPMELEEMGVEKWLRDNQKDGKIDKAAFAQWVKDNQIQIQEVMKGKNGAYTKYADYTTTGGENYREILFTLPIKEREIPEYKWILKGNDGIIYAKNNSEQKPTERLSAESLNHLYGVPFDVNVEWTEGVGKIKAWAEDTYVSPHWREKPNVLGHVRMQDFTDTDGNKVLLVEEVQSDWHQEGKEKGYTGADTTGWTAQLASRGDKANIYEVRDARGKFVTNALGKSMDEAIRNAVKEVDRDKIPPAPFRENWHEYMMKRMIRYAAENGYDKLAWTTGEQQAERYDLSKHISRIDYDSYENEYSKETEYDIKAVDHSGETVIEEQALSPKQLVNYVGKEQADKIINGKHGSLSGLDLKVGGKGMKVFYDEKIPAFINRYVKQWGAKVETSNIITPVPGFTTFTKHRTTSVHSIQITPAMREAALYEGQPLYKKNSEFNEAFWKWFGKSKVVDENGNPLVVYHGTRSQFEAFSALEGEEAHFFTDNKESAQGYARYDVAKGKPRVISAYLSLQNPMIKDYNGEQDNDVWFDIEEAKEKGHDGLILKNTDDGRGIIDQYIAFKPEQIKSIYNRGKWNPEDERILFKKESTEKEPVVFIGMQPTGSSKPALPLVNNMIGSTVTYNPDKHIIVNQEQYEAALAKEPSGKPRFMKDNANPSLSDTDTDFRAKLKDSANAYMYSIGEKAKSPLWQEIFGSPEWVKHPVIKRLVNLFTNVRSELFHDYFNNLIEADKEENIVDELHRLKNKGLTIAQRIMGETSKEYQMLERIVDEADTEQIEPDEMEMILKERNTPADVVHAWRRLRKSWDKALRIMTAELQDVLKKQKERGIVPGSENIYHLLEKALAEMGRWYGTYAPRIRPVGDYVLQATIGEGKEKQYFRTHGSAREMHELAAQMNRKGWHTTVQKLNRLPESTYQNVRTVETANLIENALRGLKDQPFIASQLSDEIVQLVADTIRARGFRQTMIHRGEKLVTGYITDPMERYVKYVSSLSGGLSKAQVARQAMATFQDIDPANEGRLHDTALNYIQENLRNLEPMDRLFGLAKSIATFKFLGFNLRSLGVNVTAIATTAPAAIHQYALGGKVGFGQIVSALTSASKDYSKYMVTGKVDNKDEQAFLDLIRKQGYDDPQYTREATSKLQKIHGQTWNKLMGASMWMFSKSEQWNRGTTMLAAYRLAKQQGMDEEEAIERAREASNRAHGVYGKGTLPSWATGNNFGAKLGQAMYTYSKFGHNYIQMLADLLKKENVSGTGKRNIAAFTWALASPVVLAGTAVFPFRAEIMALIGGILRALGIMDDPEKWWWEQVRKYLGETGEKIGRHGLTGLAGVDISGSLSIGIGIPKDLWDLTGPVGGVWDDLMTAKEYMLTGQPLRALEKAAPAGISNPIRAFRESTSGVRTEKGATIFDEKGKPMKLSPSETAMRAFGFRGVRQAVKSEQAQEIKNIELRFDERRKRIYEEVRAYFADPKRTPAQWSSVWNKVKKFNEDVISSKMQGVVSLITPATLHQQAKRVTTPTKKEKGRIALTQ